MSEPQFQPWQCHAKPAALNGRTCGHLNDVLHRTNFHGYELRYCASCGCTKHASDARIARQQQPTPRGII